MARRALILKSQKKPKYSTRINRRCRICGRSHAYMRDFGMCRICFRERASRGKLPGITKSSW